MNKRYINFEEFKEIITSLKLDEQTVIVCEEIEDMPESEYDYYFKHIQFVGTDIVLYSLPSEAVGVIQDEYVQTFDESLKGLWDGLTQDGGRMYIRE